MMASRVLYAPRNISGQATEYAEAIRPFGFVGEVWSYGPTAFGFDADRVIDPDRLLADTRYRWDLFDEAIRRFDIFHLQYSRSLLNPEGVVLPELWDLPLLKSLGKRVLMSFRGSDVRMPSTHLEREPDSYFASSKVVADEARIRSRVAICRRYCDVMLVSTPGLLDDVPDAVWLPHTIDVSFWQRDPRPERAVPIALHIPSSRTTKGSNEVDAAMRELHASGMITYRPLTGVARSALLTELQDADIVIDSLAIGDHGLISVEAMAAGAIPVAHIHDENRRRNPGVPIVEATVHDLGQVVAGLVQDPERRARIRKACATFVRERHDRSVVGAQLAELYRTAPRLVDRPYPDWPRSDTQKRIVSLEARIDELEADLDPLVRGFMHPRTRAPAWVTQRLLERIEELETELARWTPDSPVLHPRGRRQGTAASQGLRDRLKQYPTVHRVVRATRRRITRRLGR
jgi:hypothetical protein